MPYKNPADRRKRYKQRRLIDPRWVTKSRAYHRKYQKEWYRKHLSAQREYHREWKKRWRKSHPQLSRSYLRDWRRRNPEKVARWHKRWRRSPKGRTWYRKNRARRRVQQKKYYRRERRRNLAQQKTRRRRHYWKNRDRILERRRRLWAKNPELYRAREKERYHRHRVNRIVSQRNIQARRAGAKGQVTPHQWRRLLKRHNFRCFYCGTKLLPANRTLDHKIPLSRGGANIIKNVVPACRPCNQRKMKLTTKEFLAKTKKGARKLQ